MPLEVACDCGKQLKVKREFAGRRVKCPGCGVGLQLPPSHGTSDTRRPAVQKIEVRCDCGEHFTAQRTDEARISCPGCQSLVRIPSAAPKIAEPQREPLLELLDEIGYISAKSHGSCPNCKTGMPPNAILCVQCGYHMEKGKMLRTRRIGN